MANNQYVNKVEFGNQTIMDLTGDSVSPENLLEGETAHDASGAPIVGTYRGGGGGGDYYSPTDDASTDLDDADYVPFYDTSASAKKKSLLSTLWGYIKTKIGIVSGSSDNTYLKKDGTWGTGASGTCTTGTLLASNWVGNAIPYSYDMGNAYANKYVIIGYDSSAQTASDATMAAAANAKIVGGEGTTIYAYGVKPTVDIPIIIIFG